MVREKAGDIKAKGKSKKAKGKSKKAKGKSKRAKSKRLCAQAQRARELSRTQHALIGILSLYVLGGEGRYGDSKN
jgi:hypothetical protein